MREQLPEIIIFAVPTIGRRMATREYFKMNDIPYMEGGGYFGGENEVIFMVTGEHKDLALEIAQKNKQNSVLVSDQDRNTRLEHIGWTFSDDLGTLREIPAKDRGNYFAWSCFDGRYWTTFK